MSKKYLKLHRAFLVLISLLTLNRAFAGAETARALSNQWERPRLEDYIQAAYPGQTTKDVFATFQTMTDADLAAESAKLIKAADYETVARSVALLEKTFPGATFAFLGRDSVAAYEVFTAYFMGLGQNDRTVRIDASTGSITASTESQVARFIFQNGLDPRAIASGHPYVILDTTSFSANSQSHVIMSSVYLELQRMGISTELLNSKLHFVSFNRGVLKLTGSPTQLVTLGKETKGSLPIEGQVLTVAMPLTYTTEWHGTFGRLVDNADGSISSTITTNGTVATKVGILTTMEQTLRVFSSSQFQNKVAWHARMIGITGDARIRAAPFSKYDVFLKDWAHTNRLGDIFETFKNKKDFQQSMKKAASLFEEALSSVFDSVPKTMLQTGQQIIETLNSIKIVQESSKFQALPQVAKDDLKYIENTAFRDLLLLGHPWDLKIQGNLHSVFGITTQDKATKEKSSLILAAYLASQDEVSSQNLAKESLSSRLKQRIKMPKIDLSPLKKLKEPLDIFNFKTVASLAAVAYFFVGTPIAEYVNNPAVGLDLAELKSISYVAWAAASLYGLRMWGIAIGRQGQQAFMNQLGGVHGGAAVRGRGFTQFSMKAEPPTIDQNLIMNSSLKIKDKIKTRDYSENLCAHFYR